MEIIPCFRKIHWGSTQVLFPGTRHSQPSDIFPWQCVSEIVPGLFLTCEELAKDREQCLKCGYSFVMNFCAATYSHPYRVCSSVEGTLNWISFETIQDFCAALDEYLSAPVPADIKQRKVFVYNVPALDVPTYDISQHFLLCSTLLELVISARETLRSGGADQDQLHSVVVHCMVGVSRSASVVAAYLMKRAQIGAEDALAFMQSTRPVVGPNPGFRRQLGMWQSMLMLHIQDELAAKLVVDELKERHNLVETVTELLPALLENSKCAMERQYFGFIVAGALDSPDQLTLIRRELLSAIAALVDAETYVDTPKFFAHICEIVRSVETYIPELLLCFADGSTAEARLTVGWTDSVYRFVFMDLARSGYVKDTYDTARAFSSLMEMTQAKHFDAVDPAGTKLVHADGSVATSTPAFIKFSFPFLHFVVPYAEGFVPYVELSDLQTNYPLSGVVFSNAELESLIVDVRRLFLSRFLLSSCGGATLDAENNAAQSTGRWLPGSQLKHLEEDVEVILFEQLEKNISALDVVNLAQDKYLTPDLGSPALLAAGRKTLGAIVAFRILLETAEQFVLNSYSGRIDHEITPLKYTEALLPLADVVTAAKTIGGLCAARCSAPVNLTSYFRSALEPAFLAEVVHQDGVWKVLDAPCCD